MGLEAADRFFDFCTDGKYCHQRLDSQFNVFVKNGAKLPFHYPEGLLHGIGRSLCLCYSQPVSRGRVHNPFSIAMAK